MDWRRRLALPSAIFDYGHPRLLNLDAFFTKPGPYDPDIPFGTNIFHVYRDLYEREFKFVPRHERRVALMAGDNEDAPFVECFLGGFPAEGPLAGLAQAYQDAFDPVALAPTAENWIKIVREGFLSPLAAHTRRAQAREQRVG